MAFVVPYKDGREKFTNFVVVQNHWIKNDDADDDDDYHQGTCLGQMLSLVIIYFHVLNRLFNKIFKASYDLKKKVRQELIFQGFLSMVRIFVHCTQII